MSENPYHHGTTHYEDEPGRCVACRLQLAWDEGHAEANARITTLEAEVRRLTGENSAARTALANVGGALVDSGVVVPAEEWRYGEAVREIMAQREEARRQSAELARGTIGIAAMQRLMELSDPTVAGWLSNLCKAWADRCSELERKLNGWAELERAAEEREYYLGHWNQEISRHETTRRERDTASQQLASLARLASALVEYIASPAYQDHGLSWNGQEHNSPGMRVLDALREHLATLRGADVEGEASADSASSGASSNSEPRQGAAETAALFSPEMVGAITSIEFSGSFAHPVSTLRPDHHWVAVDANSTHPDLTREAAIRRAFDLSRGAAEGGGR